jgi:ariadne-1
MDPQRTKSNGGHGASHVETAMETTLQSDLDALLRVRNRLAHAPDSALPKILTGLLPRLLFRLERNCSSTVISTAEDMEPKTMSENERGLRDKAHTQLTGILTHALERIRGGRHTLPSGAPWVPALLPLLEQDLKSPVAETFLLLILQNSIPRYEADSTLEALSPLSYYVHSLHQKILASQSTPVTESTLLNFRTASWICFDILAISWGLPALIDWDRDHFEEYEWSTPSTPKEAFLEHGPRQSNNNNQTPSTCLHYSGMFQLWLDLFLFWPEESRSGRRQGRFLRAAEVLVENATGMTPEGLKRLNHRCRGQSWNIRYLRELKLACMHHVVAPLRSLRSADKLEGDVLVMRSLLLCVLTSTTGSMHGKVAIEFVNKLSLQLATNNKLRGNRCRHQVASLPTVGDAWVSSSSLLLASCLLVLVLGDRVSVPVLDKYPEEKHEIEAVLGAFSFLPPAEDDGDAEMEMEADHNRLRENLHPANGNRNNASATNLLERAPMPFGVAERALDFIMTKLLPASEEEVGSSSSAISGSARYHTNAKAGSDLRLFVDLVVALSEKKGIIGSYWAIQCLDGLYTYTRISAEQTNGKPTLEDSTNQGSWVRSFYGTCFEISSRVLSQIANVEAETMVMLGEIQQQHEPNQMLPGGVPGPFERRRDLNTLLAGHRNSQKKRQLRVDCAMRARKKAYRMVTELAPNIGLLDPANGKDSKKQKSSALLDMPVILLKCAIGEEDTSMHPHVSKALEATLAVYKQSLATSDSKTLQSQVAALLPSLLFAVCSPCSAARLAAARWVVDFVQALDPPVAWHVCNFLAEDMDPFVSGVAKKAIKTMKASVPRKHSQLQAELSFLNLSETRDLALIHADVEEQVEQIASALHLSVGVARVLLSDFLFNKDSVIASCNDNRIATLEQCGVGRHSEKVDTLMADIDETIICGICYDEVEGNQIYVMPCEHPFCHSCWESYLNCAIQERPSSSNAALAVTCPDHGCRERVTKEDLQIVAPGLAGQWDLNFIRAFIGRRGGYSLCPGPDCTIVACSPQHAKEPGKTMIAKCTHCATSFCFSCGATPHQPARCADFAEWSRIFGSSDFWVKKNAKPCPGCNVPIEKNQGCNHMKCSQCNFDFCWLCLGPLNTHLEPHICNRYQPHANAEDEEDRRALFFTDRFKAHDDAEIFAKNELKSFVEKKEKLATETLWFASDDDLELMQNATETLVRARNFLKNSYVSAWAMRNNLDQRDLFESRQANLELFTEKLSQLLLTKVHQLYMEQGARAIHLHFRAMSFSTESIIRYMSRILSVVEGTEL